MTFDGTELTSPKVDVYKRQAIDCVWNGMTLNDEVKAAMGTSVPYCLNAQVLVVPADRAADFEGLTSLEGFNVAVESGSAGEDAAEALGAAAVPVQAQANALMEVAAGTSDAAVIDLLMAGAMIGEGTSYADLTYTMNLNDAQGLDSEAYGVGFRQGSDLVDAFNTFWAEKVSDGTVLEDVYKRQHQRRSANHPNHQAADGADGPEGKQKPYRTPGGGAHGPRLIGRAAGMGLLPPALLPLLNPEHRPFQRRPAVHGAEGDDQPQRQRTDEGDKEQLQGLEKAAVQGRQHGFECAGCKDVYKRQAGSPLFIWGPSATATRRPMAPP